MTTSGSERRGVAFKVDGILFRQDGGNGFEGHTEVDVLAVADAALNAAAVIGGGGDPTLGLGDEDIVLLGATGSDARETLAIFETLDGIDTQHGCA